MKRRIIPSQTKRSRGRPKLKLADTKLKCACGGVSGTTICKYAVVCAQSHLCKRECLANPNCSAVYVDEDKEGMML